MTKIERPPSPGARAKISSRETRKVLAIVTIEATETDYLLYEIEDTGENWLCPIASWRHSFTYPTDLFVAEWATRPQPGSRWQHFKGGTYGVIANAHDVVTGQHYVIYRSEADGHPWGREIDNWNSKMSVKGKKVPRFTLLC